MGDYNPPPLPSQPSDPRPSTIKFESWRQAEQATQEIIERIQPTVVSEYRRRAVVEYVQKLIRGLLGTEVLPFGSVPLKTYLPDGDIDLTALSVPNSEDALASEVRSALYAEEQNKDAEFEVKHVQYIHAEVRLVKCLVQNIVVDISFNQIGGLCTLCFLEKVDCLVGKNNLFKRSIILIKAWCYYESRILGAHHGLISTYALETLVLYIFHLFHSSLDGPLAVLYRFLDYYSKFDWDNYCISLNGPISVSSLPELVAEEPKNGGGDLLLSKEFLRNCVETFSDLPRGVENSSRSFPPKHLNIVDPLKENNNLGRSVSKGNFYRIRSAFTYGARKLGRILLLSAESIADEINTFFMNTLERHGSGERPDVLDGLPSCPDCRTPTTDSQGELCEEINHITIDKEHGTRMQLHQYPSSQNLYASRLHDCTQSESNCHIEGNVSGRHLAGDAGDRATTGASVSRTANETRKAPPSNNETCASPSGKVFHAPHLFFRPETGTESEIASCLAPNEGSNLFVRPDSYETESSTGSTHSYTNHGIPASAGSLDGPMALRWNTYESEFSQHTEWSSTGNAEIDSNGSPKSNHLANLSGDYEMHFKSLLCAQWLREYLSGAFLPVHQSSPSQYRNRYSWDADRRWNMYPCMNANGAIPGPPFPPSGCYSMYPPPTSGAYGLEDMPKPRGTGTYFPNANYHVYKGVQSSGRGRNPVPAIQSPRFRNNGRTEAAAATNLVEKVSQDPPSQERGNLSLLDIPKSSRTASKGLPHANGVLSPSNGKIEYGSSPEVGKSLDSVSGHSHGSGTVIPASTLQRFTMSSNPERPQQSYQLKNDDDFPPLTG